MRGFDACQEIEILGEPPLAFVLQTNKTVGRTCGPHTYTELYLENVKRSGDEGLDRKIILRRIMKEMCVCVCVWGGGVLDSRSVA